MHLRPPLATSAIWIAALACLALLGPQAAQAQPEPTPRIQWRGGDVRLPQVSRQQLHDDLAGLLEAETQYIVARLRTTPTQQERDAWGARGLRLTTPLGQHHFFARLDLAAAQDATQDIDAAIGNLLAPGALLAVSRIASEWKLDPLWDQGVPAYAQLPRELHPVDATPETVMIAAHVLLHRGASPAMARAEIERCGGQWVQPLRTLPGGIVHLPLAALTTLAEADTIQWIQPPLPPLALHNDDNRAITQANTAQSLPYDLDGSGVTVMVYDGGVADTTHADFGARATARDTSGVIDHATHVSGTIGGDGTASAGQYRGMAPGVTIESYGLNIAPGGGIFLYANPGDLEADYDTAINLHGAVIANNSVGTNVAVNGFPCGILGDYGVGSSLIDGIVRGSLGPDMRIVWSAGNERGQSACGDMYNQISPPSAAKNSIVVGAVNSNDDSMTSFSGWGPTDDGRTRPDIVAPGCQSDGDFGVTSCAPGGGYTSACGTSMSAPTATGLAALVLEQYRLLNPGSPDPTNATLKSLLAHNAVDGGNPGPDYQYGYGSLRVVDTVDFVVSNNFFEGVLQHGESWDFTINVTAADPELRVTLAWDDFPGVPNVTNTLVNDLDLVVTDPSGTRHWPWTLDPANPASPAVQNAVDRTNNLEQVLVSNPSVGMWQVSVLGFDIAEGPQGFSASVTPEVQTLGLELLTSVPAVIPPQQATDLNVSITAINDSIVGGSALLHYRFDGAAFQTLPLQLVGGSEYSVTLPGADCGQLPEFYFSATGAAAGVATLPRSAPTSVYSADIGDGAVAFADDFETALGWTVGATDDNATTGVWERVDPIGTAAQPEDDQSANGTMCFVTGQGSVGGTLGENDIDGGKTTLFSPTFDLLGEDPTVSYWRWYSNDSGAGPNADIFTVDVSVDGQSWINVETVGPSGPETSGGWFFHSFRVADLVTPTATTQFRFVAEDAPAGSVVEAALDDFMIEVIECTAGDCNMNGIDDAQDIANNTSEDLDLNLVPDECECSTPLFLRGDVNRDFSLDISDAASVLTYLFLSGTPPQPLAAGDANDDGSVNLQDPLVLLGYLFGTGPSVLPAPFPGVGCDD